MNIMRRRGILRWRHVWQGLLCLPENTWIIPHWGGGIYAVLARLKKKKGQYLLAGFAILLTAALTVKAVDVSANTVQISDIGIPSIL